MGDSPVDGVGPETYERVSTRVVLHPRVSDDKNWLRIWVGLLDGILRPLDWYVNGQLRVGPLVREVRPLAPVYEPEANRRTPVITGLYEVNIEDVPGPYQVQVKFTESKGRVTSAVLPTQELPGEIPLGARFNLLLVSCFSQRTDRSGNIGRVVTGMAGPYRPHLTLLVGDQVYLDSPVGRLTGDHDELLGIFQESYLNNWAPTSPGRGYSAVLDAAPAASVPDDHEYWNNYPQPSLTALPTHTSAGYRAWANAARSMFVGFQTDESIPKASSRAVPRSSTRIIDIPPLSIFLMDNRTDRTDAHALSCADRRRYQAWIDGIGFPTIPILVTGPSLLQDAKTKFGRPATPSRVDANLANFTKDYQIIMQGLLDLMKRGSPALLLTGDVHYGRVVKAFDRSSNNSFYEVISSPSSVVEFPGLDQLKGAIDWIRGTETGSGLRWSAAKRLEGADKILAGPGLYNYYTLYPDRESEHRGDHVALLSFTRTSTGMSLEPIYYFVPKGDAFAPNPVTRRPHDDIDLSWSAGRERSPDAAADPRAD